METATRHFEFKAFVDNNISDEELDSIDKQLRHITEIYLQAIVADTSVPAEERCQLSRLVVTNCNNLLAFNQALKQKGKPFEMQTYKMSSIKSAEQIFKERVQDVQRHYSFTIIEKIVGTISIYTPFNRSYIAKIKEIPGRKWDSSARAWCVETQQIDDVKKIICEAYDTDNEHIGVVLREVDGTDETECKYTPQETAQPAEQTAQA